MGDLKPRKLPRKSCFVLDVVSPDAGRRTARGLASSDQEEANTLAHDYARLLQGRDLLLHPDLHTMDLWAFHPKATELALGANHPVLSKLREMTNPGMGLTQEDLAERLNNWRATHL